MCGRNHNEPVGSSALGGEPVDAASCRARQGGGALCLVAALVAARRTSWSSRRAVGGVLVCRLILMLLARQKYAIAPCFIEQFHDSDLTTERLYWVSGCLK
jgi:hypothetical protein